MARADVKAAAVAAIKQQTISQLREAVAQASGAAKTFLQDFERAFTSAEAKGRNERLLQVQQEAAEAGQRAMVSAYLANKKGLLPYRQNDDGKSRRFSGGLLEAALSSPNFFVVTPRTIQFGNVEFLNQQAKQWARLSFGAGGLGHDQQLSTYSFMGQQIGGGTLPARGKFADPILMPAGYWLSEAFPTSRGPGRSAKAAKTSPGPYFYPRYGKGGKSRMIRTKGIAGTGYIGTGVNVMNTTFSRGFERVANEWVEEAFKGAGTGGPLGIYGKGTPGLNRARRQMRKII